VSERENLFRPVHKGIRAMLYQLGRELQTTDFTDVPASNLVIDRLRSGLGDTASNCILCLLKDHSSHEERDLFAPLRRQDPDVVDLMMREHAEVSSRIGTVLRQCSELAQTTELPRRIELGDRLNEEANDLFAYYLTHLNREESTIVPVMWERFTDDQLRELRARFYDAVPLARFETWMRWTLPAMNANELTVLFRGLKNGPPSERFADWVRLAHETLEPGRWKELADRIPLSLP